MKVLFLAHRVSLAGGEIPPHGSGAHVGATLAGLRAHFDVLAVLAEPGPQTGSRAPRGALRSLRRVLPGWLVGLRQDLLALGEDRAFGRRALAAGRDFAPDVVYARSEYLGLSPLRVAGKLGVPLILEVNGLLARDIRALYRSPLEPVGAALERLKHRRADAVVTVSPGLARRLERLAANPDATTVVPNSVAPDRVRSSPRPAAGGQVVIGWIGHVMRWHLEALAFLVDVAPDVVRAVPEVRFLVIGGGPGLDALEQRVRASPLAGRFEFTGTISHDSVPGRLDEVDIAVIPAIFDYAFPVKLVEFGARGIPVVAPRSASLDEQIAAGREYEAFAPGERAELTAALVRLALDPDRRLRMGAALHAAVRERFTWTATGQALAALVTGVVERGRSG